MSQENVEIIRRFFDLASEGGGDAGSELYAPEIEFYEDPAFPGAEVYRGRDAVVENFEEYLASFDQYRFEIEEIFDVGDKVVAVVRELGRGKASGAEITRRTAYIATIKAGKLVRSEIFLDPADAFVAVGR